MPKPYEEQTIQRSMRHTKINKVVFSIQHIWSPKKNETSKRKGITECSSEGRNSNTLRKNRSNAKEKVLHLSPS